MLLSMGKIQGDWNLDISFLTQHLWFSSLVFDPLNVSYEYEGLKIQENDYYRIFSLVHTYTFLY